MNFIVFPGQGSQKIGMGKKLSDNFTEAKEVFEEVNEALKFNLTKIMWEGSESDISLTSNAQPALMACGVAAFKVLSKLKNKNVKQLANFVCGHSLGEYTAMAVSEVFSLQNCAVLLRLRGEAMQKAVPVGKGAMLAVLGCEISEVKQFLDELKENGVCQIANDNAPGQIIVSGNTSKINELHKTLKSQKKKAIPLPVSAPFHCDLMKIAADKMRDKILSTKFNNSLVPLVSNVTANEEKIENIQKLLIDQIFSKVRWRESIINMSKEGVTEYIEIGPGKVLSGLIKRINKDVKSTSINSIEDIESNFNGIKK